MGQLIINGIAFKTEGKDIITTEARGFLGFTSNEEYWLDAFITTQHEHPLNITIEEEEGVRAMVQSKIKLKQKVGNKIPFEIY